MAGINRCVRFHRVVLRQKIRAIPKLRPVTNNLALDIGLCRVNFPFGAYVLSREAILSKEHSKVPMECLIIVHEEAEVD